MASSEKNLSAHQEKGLSNLSKKRVAIIVSDWNEEITEALYVAAYQTLVDNGIKKSHLSRVDVPGSYELPLAALWLAKERKIDAVICLGCVIQGETRHFEFISQTVAQGIKDVSLKTGKPVIFGVLTTDNKKQALDRAGGKFGNKGDEAAITVLKMLSLSESRKKSAKQ